MSAAAAMRLTQLHGEPESTAAGPARPGTASSSARRPRKPPAAHKSTQAPSLQADSPNLFR
jgi:hypothetical protein